MIKTHKKLYLYSGEIEYSYKDWYLEFCEVSPTIVGLETNDNLLKYNYFPKIKLD